jgi:hypothetical protein
METEPLSGSYCPPHRGRKQSLRSSTAINTSQLFSAVSMSLLQDAPPRMRSVSSQTSQPAAFSVSRRPMGRIGTVLARVGNEHPPRTLLRCGLSPGASGHRRMIVPSEDETLRASTSSAKIDGISCSVCQLRKVYMPYVKRYSEKLDAAGASARFAQRSECGFVAKFAQGDGRSNRR